MPQPDGHDDANLNFAQKDKKKCDKTTLAP